MTGQKWGDLAPKLRAQIAEVLTSDDPGHTLEVIRAGLTPDQQPHAQTIFEAFEEALAQLRTTPEERLGTALVDAYRRGEDPARIFP